MADTPVRQTVRETVPGEPLPDFDVFCAVVWASGETVERKAES